jgi:hypothetical protein
MAEALIWTLFFIVIILPLCILKHVDWRIAIGATLLAFVGTFMTIEVDSYSFTLDNEIWNGEISSKFNDRRSCQTGWHSYQDSFCTEYRTREVDDPPSCSGSGKDRTCTPQSHTEYKYLYSWEGKWFVYAKNLKNTSWQIKRVDRQGAIEPPTYTLINVGDPASIPNSYTNYVKAASDSLFNDDGSKEEKYKDLIPTYPDDIYNGFKIDRVISVGIDSIDLKKYSLQLSNVLKDLGPNKQMNAIIVLSDAKKTDIDFSFAVRRAWKGFKKNDAVIFIGLDDKKIAWTSVLSWSKFDIFNVDMRESINDLKGKDIDDSLPTIIQNLHDIGMKDYQRREMKDFEYLASQIPRSTYAIIATVLLMTALIVGSIILTRKVKL